ncbi:MAG: hypothetical protein N3G20_04465, partial [Verrucomicrobiae bacterium]|nr:hypothetical protein [Verrucomicrobiae bacterium]
MSGVKSTNPSKGTQAGPACVDAAWRTLVIVSGLFCAVVALAMLTRDILAHKRDPLKAPELTALKLQLSKSPNDETLKQKIREVDLEIRREYFETVRFKKTG